jgi:ketosteroid isomerase-like protein
MSEENVERLREVYAEWAVGNFRAGGALLAEDVVFEPMFDGRTAYVGRAAVEKQMRDFIAQWSEFRVEAHDFVDAGETVVVTERQYGMGKSSGVEIETTFFAAWTFRDGLVTRIRWDADRTRALEAAGLRE